MKRLLKKAGSLLLTGALAVGLILPAFAASSAETELSGLEEKGSWTDRPGRSQSTRPIKT